MKVLFIQQDVFKNYGTMLISGILKKNGHECDILIDALEKDLMKEIKLINPDLIAFSISTTIYSWMKDTAKKIKSEFKKPIIVGGPHPTFFPEVINDESVDIICVGEGEDAIIELVNKIEKGENITKIQNLWVKKDGKIYKNPIRHAIENLDSIPYADRDIYRKYSLFRDQNVDVFMSGRGCPYNCTFCFNKGYNELYKGKGKVLRRRSVPSIIDEIKKAISNNKKVNYIVFYDDTFILGEKEWFNEFFQRYKDEINLPFSATVRANLVNDEIINMLKTAGCNSVKMGIESADPYIRNIVLKKGITNEQIIDAVKIIKKNKLKFQFFNILGAPGENINTALDTYELSYKLHPQHAWCSLMHPFPGTELNELVKQQNLVKKEHGFEDLDSSIFSSLPIHIENKREIVNLQKLFQFGVFFRIPRKWMARLVKLHMDRLFELIFKINYGIGVKRMDNLSWSYLFKVALHSKNYFKKRK